MLLNSVMAKVSLWASFPLGVYLLFSLDRGKLLDRLMAWETVPSQNLMQNLLCASASLVISFFLIDFEIPWTPYRQVAWLRSQGNLICPGMLGKCLVNDVSGKMHTYNPSTQDGEAGELQVQGQPPLLSEFKTTLHYIASPCLKEQNKTRENAYLSWDLRDGQELSSSRGEEILPEEIISFKGSELRMSMTSLATRWSMNRKSNKSHLMGVWIRQDLVKK